MCISLAPLLQQCFENSVTNDLAILQITCAFNLISRGLRICYAVIVPNEKFHGNAIS